MLELNRRTGARFEVFSTTPRWFYDESVEGLYDYHEVVTDVGLRQASALAYDLEATMRALRALVPFEGELVDGLARTVRDAGCRAVICDIAPLGIAVAARARVPSVLLESFLWPWLYEPLLERAPGLGPLADEMTRWFECADLHLQTEPLCERSVRARAVLPPVGRPPRRSRSDIRRELGLPESAPVVVLTMGGVPERLPFLPELKRLTATCFLVTGVERSGVDGNLHLFDNDTRVYMPDFLRAADAVVAKLGYSTVAETWAEGLPMAYVTRPDFRETGPLRRWVSANLHGFEIPGPSFVAGGWVDRVQELLALPRTAPQVTGGADAAADLILEMLGGQSGSR